jgi:tetratricopeptide (TPR) repeat protein
LAAQFVLIQQYFRETKYELAESILEKMLKNESFATYRQGIASLLIFIYEHLEKSGKALKLLASVNIGVRFVLIQDSKVDRSKAAFYKLGLGKYADALIDFEWLIRNDPENKRIKAGYMICLAKSGTGDLSELISEFSDNVVVDKMEEEELENLPVSMELDVAHNKKKNRKRKKPVPKNFDPKKTPDPGKHN